MWCHLCRVSCGKKPQAFSLMYDSPHSGRTTTVCACTCVCFCVFVCICACECVCVADCSRSVCKHRLVKQSTLAVDSLVLWHRYGCICTAVYFALWYGTLNISTLRDWHHKNVQFQNKSTGTYAPEFTVPWLNCWIFLNAMRTFE